MTIYPMKSEMGGWDELINVYKSHHINLLLVEHICGELILL